MVHGIQQVQTPLISLTDDHVFYKDQQTLRVCAGEFDDPRVGLCGTTKTVRRQSPTFNPTLGKFWLLWKLLQLPRMYWQLYWNFLGSVYLTRHNYEITATNSLDGVFVVSARTMVVRTKLVRSPEFVERFMNEQVFLGWIGPLTAGDDNFITRWVLCRGYNVKITDKTFIETTLGIFPKFIWQCLRWRRTTFQTMGVLLVLPLWLCWPLTTWLSFIPMLSNLALFWDGGMMYTLTRTNFFSEAENPGWTLIYFGTFIYFTKLPKLIPHFLRYPTDFILFFFPIPAYHLFAYFHSLISIWTFLTIWDISWSRRNLPMKGD